MAKSVNKVFLLGNLGKDPEVKYTPSGMCVAKFSLATNERQKDRDGNWQDKTEWHNCVAFQKTAEIAGEYLKKGSTVFIEGSLRTSSWDDKDSGQKKYRTEILVNNLVMCGVRNRESDASRDDGEAQGSYSKPASSPNVHGAEITDEDIPF